MTIKRAKNEGNAINNSFLFLHLKIQREREKKQPRHRETILCDWIVSSNILTAIDKIIELHLPLLFLVFTYCTYCNDSSMRINSISYYYMKVIIINSSLWLCFVIIATISRIRLAIAKDQIVFIISISSLAFSIGRFCLFMRISLLVFIQFE